MKNKFSWKEDIMITTWLIFEMAGTIAFAFSGAAVGLYKRMDIFGITVLSVMTAVGGNDPRCPLWHHAAISSSVLRKGSSCRS